MSEMDRGEFFTRWSRLHGDAPVRTIVKWWLSIAFALARFLQRLRLTANALTIIGVLIAICLTAVLLHGRSQERGPLLFALTLLVISLAADGLDGSLALLTSTESRLGAALDAIADRIVEAFWAYAFVLLGADFRVVIIAWLIAQSQEYIRARLGGLGVAEIGVISLCERPVRASILAIAFVISLIYSAFGWEEFYGLDLRFAITITALSWLILQSIAIIQVCRFAIRSTIGSG